MNLNQLKLFYLAVKYKSLSQAAVELNITQPAVSKGIQRLQEYYEVPLVHNLVKNMELTLAGDNLFQIAKKIFELEKLGDDCMADFQSENLKHLKINASESFGAYYLPEFINQFNLKAPNVRVTLEVLSNGQVVENTVSLKNDIGFVSFPVKDNRLNTIEIIKDEIVIILNPSHSLAQKKQIKATDLEGHMIIMHEEGSYFQKMIHDLLDADNVSVTMPITFSNNEAIKKAVEDGLGIALVSRNTVYGHIQTKKLAVLPLPGPPITHKYYIVHHKDKYFSGVLNQLVKKVDHWALEYHRSIQDNII